MVSEIVLHNKTLNTYITLNRTNSSFYLDDNSPDWGTVQSGKVSYPMISTGIGSKLVKITAYNPRIITIIGWLANDESTTISQKKRVLNTFCNIFDEVEILAGEYSITGYFDASVIYSHEDKDNNDCKCKFMFTISCLQPMFTKGEITLGEATGELVPAWFFPWAISENFVFGTKVKYNYAMINNVGAVATGFIMEVTTTSNITGLFFDLNDQHFALKSNYVLSPGTKIIISTVENETGIWTEVANVKTKAFNIIDLNSDFMQVPVGINKLDIGCESGSISSLSIAIKFKPLYYAMEDE